VKNQIKDKLQERMLEVARALCNAEGGPSLGGRKLHSALTTQLNSRVGQLPLESLASLIASQRAADKFEEAASDDDTAAKLVYMAANGRSAAVLAELVDIPEAYGAVVTGLLGCHKFNIAKAHGDIMRAFVAQACPVKVEDMPFDTDSIAFARMFAYARVWRMQQVPVKIKMLKAACRKFSELPDDPEKAAAECASIETFMASEGAARKSASSMGAYTSLLGNLNHECCKAFFEYGVIVHPAFTQWIEDAVAAAHAWGAMQPGLGMTATSMCNDIFLLSCADRMQPPMIDEILKKFESGIAYFQNTMIPPGLGLLWEFKSRAEYPDEILVGMFKRINRICGRRGR
jgi:hypothetical protein